MHNKSFSKKLDEALGLVSHNLADAFKDLPDHPAKKKLLNWALSKNKHTNPRDRHTSDIIKNELYEKSRLVGNPWKEDVEESDLKDLYVYDYGEQLIVSLYDNKDVVPPEYRMYMLFVV
jgi:hypothetical protein